ncbi:RNA degradosome polyphosphate kinase [Streptomyces sp. NP160]|uniref:RNA degradosome polyphosphate kinase n=1 Tax=Streptomyces sp. NP160 TaxID=2586637 RepID=UPI00111A3739|nr:RNA degradosome polyphosphate kinase [Streptomyces sp. NP160]TNM59769.1 RNA degradosome polyphosphate kinase [Streptomyces sp. NP160]
MASTTSDQPVTGLAPSPAAAAVGDGAEPHPAAGAAVDLEEALTEHLAAEDDEVEERTGAVEEVVESDEPEPLPADRFGDRELSWLAFNQRVLELAEDPSVPLLERTRFLAIFASNLDEFFMVRVAGLKRRIATGLAVTAASGLEPREVLAAVSERAHELVERHARTFTEQVRPALAEEGIRIVGWDELEPSEQDRLHEFFRDSVFPVLTPLAVDPAHPFPYISGLSLNLAVVVRNPNTEKEHFARVKVPPLLPRLVRVEQGKALSAGRTARFVPLEVVISQHLDQLFPGMDVVAHHTFRVTRNEDLEVEEDDAENLLQALEKELLRRRFGPPVRLELTAETDDHVRELLVRELGVEEAETYVLPGPLDLRGLNAVADLERHELSYPTFVPKTHRHLTDGRESSQPRSIFAAVRSRDVLLHHPYDSFSTSVQAFLEQAAADPKVLAIKQTLYRTSGDSPIVDALIDAADAGKQVLALVEIKARFDEQNNITWARKLEQAGVHVVYGIVGLKTHSKLCLVVRQEGDRLRRYCHVGTGNYNPKTARLYEDLGLLTCDDEVGEDLTKLFNQLSGYAPRTRYSRLLVAPRSLRRGLVQRIEREAEHHRAGRPAHIRIKVNSMVDEAVIDALYRASQAGVPVDVVVRGICALRPGVPGLSETIRVRSVLGRFLEHSRIFAFEAGGDAEVYIGSADMMHRNLDRRVEALVRIRDVEHQRALVDLVDLAADAGTASWHLGPEGTWERAAVDDAGEPLLDLQEFLIAARSNRRARRR